VSEKHCPWFRLLMLFRRSYVSKHLIPLWLAIKTVTHPLLLVPESALRFSKPSSLERLFRTELQLQVGTNQLLSLSEDLCPERCHNQILPFVLGRPAQRSTWNRVSQHCSTRMNVWQSHGIVPVRYKLSEITIGRLADSNDLPTC